MRRGPLLIVAAGMALIATLPARAATPESGSISKKGPGITWTGAADAPNPSPAGCLDAADPTCDHFVLTIEPVKHKDVRITIDVAEGEDWDLFVFGPDGTPVAQGAQLGAGEDETAILRLPAKGTYTVSAQPWLVTPGIEYAGTATFVHATAAGEPEPEPDDEKDCQEFVPHAASPVLTETPENGDAVSLDVAVLADGVTAAQATEVAEKAATSYAPFNVQLHVVSITPVDFPADGLASDGRPRQDATRMIELAKEHFGGERPAGADLVYVITPKNIDDPTLGEAVAGLADCIGGVEHPAHAFAVGELDEPGVTIGPLGFYVESSVKVMAHELGHLMGAHHHYANCVEGISGDDLSGDTGPCTLMSNFVDFQGRNFGTLESAVVRAHAWDYAQP
jgi:hypothetical protein